MSGHSKWAKTHRQKAATDAKRGAIFTKLGNLITIAAKEGSGDLETNFKLRLAIEKAKSANMPKDNIDRAIKRGTGEGSEGAIFEELIYEVFGPANSGFVVEAITDNKNRTLSDLKTVLNKNGGQLGAAGSVMWMFERLGVIVILTSELANHNKDELELSIIDAGAQDIIKDDQGWEIRTQVTDLQPVTTAIEQLGLQVEDSSLAYIAKEELSIKNNEDQQKIDRLMEVLDEIDDVTNVYTNATW